jgi:hypothetical protein
MRLHSKLETRGITGETAVSKDLEKRNINRIAVAGITAAVFPCEELRLEGIAS